MSFLRKGRRIEDKRIKKHTKEFYKILGEMDTVAQKLYISGESIDEDNIVEKASKYTHRNIDGMEQMILLSKLNSIKEKEQ